mmetsp:Transcript_56013/g.124950  ORF Transcript_56013/g.124950 Transcript_56013/m.124950 type:complete len:456 (-) Transcript_56013:78-1445(-)
MAATAAIVRAIPRRACTTLAVRPLSRCAWHSRRSFAAGFGQFPFGGGGFPGGGGGGDDRLYQLLELDRNASEAQIKQAYKKQAMKYHPDRGGDEAKFKDISKAYEVLSDPQRRQIYDAYGEAGLEGAGAGADAGGAGPGVNPFDLFSSIFGFQAGSGQRRRGRPMTQDARYEVQLTLEELYAGTSRSINYTKDTICKTCNGKGGSNPQQCQRCKGRGVVLQVVQIAPGMVQQSQSICSDCQGKGFTFAAKDICRDCGGQGTVKEKVPFQVTVDPGSEDGAEFRFPGASDEAPGHDAGDLIIVIREKTHPTFQRVQDSLVVKTQLSLAEALCGFERKMKFLDGSDLVIRSEPNQVVKPGDMMVMRGKGMPSRRTHRTGDLFVQIQVDFPKEIPSSSRQPLAELLGGKALSSEASTDSSEAPAKKLSDRQVRDVNDRWRQYAESKEQQAGAQQCAQQ